jgi:hypothetical protein
VSIFEGFWAIDRSRQFAIIKLSCGKLMIDTRKKKRIIRVPEVRYRKFMRDRERLLKIRSYIRMIIPLIKRMK